jgi:hypothetical protein
MIVRLSYHLVTFLEKTKCNVAISFHVHVVINSQP